MFRGQRWVWSCGLGFRSGEGTYVPDVRMRVDIGQACLGRVYAVGRAYAHTYIHTSIHMYIRTYIDTYIHTYKDQVPTSLPTYLPT